MTVNRILKYPVDDVSRLPTNATFLHAGLDPASKPCIWVMGDESDLGPDLRVFTLGTGMIVKDEYSFLGSYRSGDGSFMWHIFTIPA